MPSPTKAVRPRVPPCPHDAFQECHLVRRQQVPVVLVDAQLRGGAPGHLGVVSGEEHGPLRPRARGER